MYLSTNLHYKIKAVGKKKKTKNVHLFEERKGNELSECRIQGICTEKNKNKNCERIVNRRG